jgi:hypothetical protein
MKPDVFMGANMPFDAYWIHESRVTAGRFWGEITMEELVEANKVAIERIRAGTPPVHVVVDTLAIEKMPVNLKAITGLIAYTKEPNLGYIIYVAHNPLVSFFNAAITRMAGAKSETVRTMEEALAMLPRLDQSLPNLSLPEAKAS